MYSPVPNKVGGGLNKRGGGPTDDLNINKRGSPNKRGGGSEKCSWSKVATRYD